MRCEKCYQTFPDEDQQEDHWCVPHANWVEKGIFDFIVRTIESRNSYKAVAENHLALSGFSSCLAIPVTLLSETALKSLLALEGHEVRRGDVWGHDLFLLFNELSTDSKKSIQDIYNGVLPSPFEEWKSTGESLEQVLYKERSSFERWRYLAHNSQEQPTSNPYNLAAVAFAIYSAHVNKTDLPTYPEVN